MDDDVIGKKMGHKSNNWMNLARHLNNLCFQDDNYSAAQIRKWDNFMAIRFW